MIWMLSLILLLGHHEPIIQQDIHLQQQTTEFSVTAYTAGIESTGKRKEDSGYGITASGRKVRPRVTAACPKNIPFGTWVFIQKVGFRRCDDRGSAIKGRRIDVYIPRLNDAIDFGRKQLSVTILWGVIPHDI